MSNTEPKVEALARTAEEEIVDAVTSVHAEASRAATEARAVLERARADVQAGESSAAAAMSAHVDTPDDRKLATAAMNAEASLTLSRKRLAHAQERTDRAEEAHGGAARALDAAKRDVRKAELRGQASPEAFVAAVQDPTRELLAGFARLKSAVEAIRTAHAASVAASTELRSLGEHQPDLHPLHAMAPALRCLAQIGLMPYRLGGANPHLEDLVRASFRSGPDVAAEDLVAVVALLASVGPPPVRAEWAPAAFAARLERFQGGRGLHELWDRERANEKARTPPAPSTTAASLGAPSMNGRVFHAPTREGDGEPVAPAGAPTE